MALFWTDTVRNRLQVWGLSVVGSLLLHVSMAFAAVYLAGAVLSLPAEKPVQMDVIVLELPALELAEPAASDSPAAPTTSSVPDSSASTSAVESVEPVVSVKSAEALERREFSEPVKPVSRARPVAIHPVEAKAVIEIPVADARPVLPRTPITQPVVHRKLPIRAEAVPRPEKEARSVEAARKPASPVMAREAVTEFAVAPVTREKKAVPEVKHDLADALLAEALTEGLIERQERFVPADPVLSRPMAEMLGPKPMPQEVAPREVARLTPAPVTRFPLPEVPEARQESGPSDQPRVQGIPAKAAPSARPDFGWVAQALWQRLAQLKRYPPVARINRWEGTVVIRAVVKQGGDLADLALEKSSGHATLDEDALELLRLVSPVPLPYELGRPELQVRVPITYKLE